MLPRATTSCLIKAHRLQFNSAVRQYHEKVLDHYERPRNVGSLDKNDKNVGTGIVGAPAFEFYESLSIDSVV